MSGRAGAGIAKSTRRRETEDFKVREADKFGRESGVEGGVMTES